MYLYDSSSAFPATSKSGLSQVGGKVTYAGSMDTYVTLEASLLQATDAPPAGTRYLGFTHDNRVVVGMLAARKVLSRHTLDAIAVATSSGPSLVVVGRYAYNVIESLAVGVGGLAVAGPSAYDGSIGSMVKGLDQVFVFASYRP